MDKIFLVLLITPSLLLTWDCASANQNTAKSDLSDQSRSILVEQTRRADGELERQPQMQEQPQWQQQPQMQQQPHWQQQPQKQQKSEMQQQPETQQQTRMQQQPQTQNQTNMHQQPQIQQPFRLHKQLPVQPYGNQEVQEIQSIESDEERNQKRDLEEKRNSSEQNKLDWETEENIEFQERKFGGQGLDHSKRELEQERDINN